jgi:serine protease Do
MVAVLTGVCVQSLHMNKKKLKLITKIALLSLVCSTQAWALTNPPPVLKIQEEGISKEMRARTSFAPVIKKVSPSIVNIYSTMTIPERQSRTPSLEEPFLRHFFGDDSTEQPRRQSKKAQSLGSGVIVSPNGYILTANHVVEGADKVKVSLSGGATEYDARVIGSDPPTDVAVLRIEAADLPAITITDSDKLEVGDTVLAVGNPFDVGRTVTMGIVSAISRGGFGINAYEDFIQTDAAINPGNSGGALVDAEGRLVGINTAILSGSGGFQGVGFAVPINLARYVMDQITKGGKVARGFLGVMLEQELTPNLARKLGLPSTSGALVTDVEPDSPAEGAGFKPEDFVLELNGKKVNDMRQLRLNVAQMAPGTKVSLKVLRDGKERTITAVLGKLPEENLTRFERPPPREKGPGVDALDGVEVVDIDPRSRRQVGMPGNLQGAMVSNIDPDSNAAEAGLRTGDVIVAIDHHPVSSAEQAVALSEKSKGDEILLRVWSPRRGMHYPLVDNTKRK